jgi:3-deoxy-D-manno-octulosonate 8-phosphate phosphatase (KDO 8-P phosphatase)
VPNAVDDVKKLAHHITANRGGRGAVREIVDLILKSQGKWDLVTSKYFQ